MNLPSRKFAYKPDFDECVAYASDGRRVATATKDHVRIWDLGDGRELCGIESRRGYHFSEGIPAKGKLNLWKLDDEQ